jgi:RNA polymerase sigma factor (sigma-70 family)
VWAVALPRLPDIKARDGRFTPVLLTFLGSVLLQDYRNLLAKHMNKPVARQPAHEPESISGDPMNQIAAVASSAASHVVRSERARELRDALDRLSDEDREIVVLHGIEQLPFKVIAAKLNANESTLRSRYHRALQELKRCFPSSMISEMEEP